MAPSPAKAAISSSLSKSLTRSVPSFDAEREGAAHVGSLRIRIREAHSRWSHRPNPVSLNSRGWRPGDGSSVSEGPGERFCRRIPDPFLNFGFCVNPAKVKIQYQKH